MNISEEFEVMPLQFNIRNTLTRNLMLDQPVETYEEAQKALEYFEINALSQRFVIVSRIKGSCS